VSPKCNQKKYFKIKTALYITHLLNSITGLTLKVKINLQVINAPCPSKIGITILTLPIHNSHYLRSKSQRLQPHKMPKTRHSHKHGAQFNKVTVVRILNFNNTPWVESSTNLSSSYFQQCVGSTYSKWDSFLELSYLEVQYCYLYSGPDIAFCQATHTIMNTVCIADSERQYQLPI
jgi:hypothetical protein